MRVIHISHYDIQGGAARAAYRLHRCLRSEGMDSRMWVDEASSGDWTIDAQEGRLARLSAFVRSKAEMRIANLLKTKNKVLHSPAVLSSNWLKRINNCSADLVHLHWVQGGMLSIKDISRISKPVVWTLHDMWAFCGAEHYTDDSRWRDGYCQGNRPFYESGFDLNRWTWARKRKHFKTPFHIITPSHWLGDCVQSSALMGGWPVSVVPNPIDTTFWKPEDKSFARSQYGLQQNGPVLLFGAIAGGQYERKGFDLLLSALSHLHEEEDLKNLQLVVFGQREPELLPDFWFPIHYTGHLYDDVSLRLLYNAADALVIPSRQDNLPNTGVEAQSCGIPVVGFNIGGLSDIVDHQRTGYLARAFDTKDLASGVSWVLKNGQNGQLGKQARSLAVERFSRKNVFAQISKIYDEVVQRP